MGEPVWDRRLLTPARALELAGAVPLRVVRVDHGDGGVVETMASCADATCRRKVCELGWRLDVDTLLSSVLRHLVVHHNLSLSATPSEGDPDGGTREPKGPGRPGRGALGGEPDPDPGRRLAEAPAGGRASGGQ